MLESLVPVVQRCWDLAIYTLTVEDFKSRFKATSSRQGSFIDGLVLVHQKRLYH